MQDLRFALRQLRKNPGFAVTTVLTLALGIGATTAIFSLVNAVLLQPLAFPEQDRLMWMHQRDHSLPGVLPEALSYPTYFDWRAQNHTFSGIASYHSNAITFEAAGEAQHLDGQTVSANFFQVLGVAPMLGRDFRWDDEKPGNRAVMLSYSLWQSAFGSANEIVGRTIKMGDDDYVVAGVMPRGFQFPLEGAPPALWLSLADDADAPQPKPGQRNFEPRTRQRGNDSLNAIGRLKPGVTLEQARSDMNLIAAGLAKQYPSYKWYSSALIEPELQHMIGDTRQGLRVLFGAVTLVLLIACANVAALLLARGSRRTAEFALRAAIGASRAKIMRQLLVESLVLSFLGGAAGVALAFGLLQSMVRLIPRDIPRIGDASIDGSVLAFVVVVSVVTGLLFGVLPAWRMSQLEPVQALREGARGMAGGRGQHRVHAGLVIAQTAIGLVLLIGSGLLIRSFVRILNLDPGFDPRHMLTARIGVSFDRLSHDQHSQFYDQLVAKLAALPGVQAASAGWPLPMSSSNAGMSFSIKGDPVSEADHPSESIGVVLPGYFETMRIPLLSGRLFGQQDGVKGAPVIIVNQTLAKKYFPREDPVGKHIQVDLGDGVFDKPMREVVGVVGDIRRKGLTADAEPAYYLPYAQAVMTNPFLTIRTSGDPASVENELRATLHYMDKSVPLYQVSALESYVSKSVAQPRFQTLLLCFFAGIALILSAIGLYGLLSYTVAQRTFEIGLRMALGAQRSDVLRMIVRRGLTLALVGLGAGLAISVMMTRVLSGMLYGIRPSDPPTFATVTALLLSVSLAASGVPAYRAARLDPVDTLRDQ